MSFLDETVCFRCVAVHVQNFFLFSYRKWLAVESSDSHTLLQPWIIGRLLIKLTVALYSQMMLTG